MLVLICIGCSRRILTSRGTRSTRRSSVVVALSLVWPARLTLGPVLFRGYPLSDIVTKMGSPLSIHDQGFNPGPFASHPSRNSRCHRDLFACRQFTLNEHTSPSWSGRVPESRQSVGERFQTMLSPLGTNPRTSPG